MFIYEALAVARLHEIEAAVAAGAAVATLQGYNISTARHVDGVARQVV